MTLETTSTVLAAIRAAARAAHPLECCGILLGESGSDRVRIVEALAAANVAPDPARYFEIDPAALIAAHRAARGGGPAVVGYYHSHPSGIAEPSAVDRSGAAGDGRIWAIAADDAIGWWRDDKRGFVRISPAVR